VANRKIALYGGGFNPIGRHHEFAAILIHKSTGMRTWFMPCYDHLFSKDSELIEVKHRWNMVMEVTNQFPEQMMAFDFEMRQKHTGSMYETMEMLKPGNPDIDFHIVIGMDNANCIESDWDRGNLLIQEYPFIVMHRRMACPACRGNKIQCALCDETGKIWLPPTTDWFKQEPHAELKLDYLISSSDIRKAIAEGRLDFARQHLNPMVWDYIETGNLFGLG
jgi:nicotinate (nicotinamide) nucleotide adenylyltransferase